MKTAAKVLLILVACAAVITAVIFLTVPKETVTTYTASVEAADKLAEEGDYVSAIIEYYKVTKSDPSDSKAYLGLAKAYARLDERYNAIIILEQGIKASNDESLKAYLSEMSFEENTIDSAIVPEVTEPPMTTAVSEPESAAETVSDTEIAQTTETGPVSETVSSVTEAASEITASETADTSSEYRVILPDFVGLTKEEAQALADEKGIVIGFREIASFEEHGTVVSQIIPAGVEIPVKITIWLSVSRGE